MDFATISGIASVLGFGLQSFETFINKHGDNKINNHMALLVEISPLTEAWKSVHKDYHSVLNDVGVLYSLVSVYEGRSVLARPADDVKQSDIKKALSSGNLSTAVSDFKLHLQDHIETIKCAGEKRSSDEESMRKLKNDAPLIFQQITNIKKASLIANRDHISFCEFLDHIEEPVVNGNLNEEIVKFIIEKRRVISIDFNRVISEADRAIIALLQIYKVIVEEVR